MKLKLTNLLPVGIVLAFSMMSITACNNSKAKDEGAKKDKGIQVGTSCEGLDSMSAKMVCVDNNLLFCSSYTGYKFKLQTACTDDQVCVVAPGGKSASCKPK